MDSTETQDNPVLQLLVNIAEAELIRPQDDPEDAPKFDFGEEGPTFEIFSGTVTNKDFITQEDLKNYFESQGVPHSADIAKDLIAILDFDQDGVIGRGDWDTYIESKERKDEGESKKPSRENDYDRPKVRDSNDRHTAPRRGTDQGTDEKLRLTMASTADKSNFGTGSKFASTYRPTRTLNSEIKSEKYNYNDGGVPVEKEVVTKITRGKPSDDHQRSRFLTSKTDRPTKESKVRDTLDNNDEVDIHAFGESAKKAQRGEEGPTSISKSEFIYRPRDERHKVEEHHSSRAERRTRESKTGEALERSKQRTSSRHHTQSTTYRSVRTATFGQNRSSSRNRPSLASSSNDRLIRKLIESIEGQREVEHRRADLAIQSNIDLAAIFEDADRLDRSKLSPSDLRSYLSKIGVSTTFSHIEALVDAYDKDGDGHLSYSEFCSLLLPHDSLLRRDVLARVNSLDKPGMNYESEVLVRSFFRTVLNAESNWQSYSRELKGRLHELFDMIGTRHNFNPSIYQFKELLSANQFYATADEIEPLREKLGLQEPVVEVHTYTRSISPGLKRSTSISQRKISIDDSVEETTTTTYYSEPRQRYISKSARSQLYSFRESPNVETTTYYTHAPRYACCSDCCCWCSYSNSGCCCSCVAPHHVTKTITVEASPVTRSTTTYITDDYHSRHYPETVVETEITETVDRYPYAARRHKFGSKHHDCGYLLD